MQVTSHTVSGVAARSAMRRGSRRTSTPWIRARTCSGVYAICSSPGPTPAVHDDSLRVALRRTSSSSSGSLAGRTSL